jgi:anthranilate phosphoribosyltransferase
MTASVSRLLERLLRRENLGAAEAAELLRSLAEETFPPAAAGAVLAALRAKGETAEELRGFAEAMRALARPVVLPARMPAADVVGTGGDGSGSFNISTGSALVAAACGVPVVKHGNRAVSSQSGSADVLERLGVPIANDPEAALECLARCNFCFLFAPSFHPATRVIAPVRRALGVRTIFNLLGPLSNPAAPPYGLFGAFDVPTAALLADALCGMSVTRAFVVHGEPGWDEATPVGPFTLFDVRDGKVERTQRDPATVGIPRCAAAALAGGDAAANAAALAAVLRGTDRGAHRDALLLGAGLVLELTGRAADLRTGIGMAATALDAGAGGRLLDKLRSSRSSSA